MRKRRPFRAAFPFKEGRSSKAFEKTFSWEKIDLTSAGGLCIITKTEAVFLRECGKWEVKGLTFYNFLSSILSYVFTLIIYLFIFGVIRLIYLDVKKMSRFEDGKVNVSGVETASLKTVHSKNQTELALKNRYMIYGQAVIGRSKSCDIVLREQYISNQHVRIWFEKGEWYLEDLGSRNGTEINGQRIRQRVMLDPQDDISVGGLHFIFEL